MLSQREIRLVRSNISLYLSLIVRLGVSVGFAVLVARKLELHEFAALGLLMAFTTIAQQFTMLWVFWAQRWVSRGDITAAGTGLAMTFIYTLMVIPVYAAFSLLESWVLGIRIGLLLEGALFVIISTILYYLSSIALVTIPAMVGALKTLYEVTRFLLAYLMIAWARLGYGGAILSITLAAGVTVLAYLMVLSRDGLVFNRASKSLALDWIRYWRIPFLYMVTRITRLFNRPYISWVTGSSLAVAYLNVAVAGETPLIMASNLTSMPMYSRILKSPSSEDVETSISLYLVFTGLLASLFIGAARAIANLYNPQYVSAATALQLVAFYAIFNGVANIVRQALLAVEQPELERGRVNRGNLLEKTLRYSTTLSILPYIIVAPIVYILRGDATTSVNTFLSTLIIFSITQAILFTRWLGRELGFNLPLKDIGAFVVGIGFSTAYLYMSGVNINLYARFWPQFTELAINSIVAIAIYTFIILLLSPLARRIVARGVELIRNLIH